VGAGAVLVFAYKLRAFVQSNLGWLIALAVFYVLALVSITEKNASLDSIVSYFQQRGPVVVFGSIVSAIFVILMYRFFRFYLNPDEVGYRSSSRDRNTDLIYDLSSKFNEALTRLEKRASEQGALVTPELFQTTEERERFKDRIADDIRVEATKSLEDKIVKELAARSEFSQATLYQVQIKERLYRVVAGLERRANLNLSVGATIGAGGIGLLIYLLYIAPPAVMPSSEYALLALQYFARVSIVFLIEIFAFFFLKLYSQTLGELRYTHNEITNTEMKLAGLQAAIASGDKKSLGHAVQKAIDTERNFILDKGKTTIDLERYRDDNLSSTAATGLLREIFLNPLRTIGRPSGQKK
jgi:hypothetical protein